MSNTTDLQIVNFTVGSVDYGVPVEQVREIREMQAVTPIPGTPDFIEGVTNLRGQVITVLNLKRRLGLASDNKGSRKIMIVEAEKATAGVVVDSVAEVSRIPLTEVERQLETVLVNSEYIIGVGKQAEKLIVILNLAKIIRNSNEPT